MKKFSEIQDYMMSRLQQGLPSYLKYHDVAHTRDVIKKSILLGELENLSSEEIYLIKTAALYHDSGFLIAREDHEEKSCSIAQEDLTEMNFEISDIQTICNMIRATKIPQKAQNKYEHILADADLFYLGTEDYTFYAGKLYEELQYFSPEITAEEWFNIQVAFMEQHHFFTEYGKSILSPIKQKNLRLLKESAPAN